MANSYLVTDIELDFDEDEEYTQHYYDNITADVLSTPWYADDEDDLVEEITEATGWCIKSINYKLI